MLAEKIRMLIVDDMTATRENIIKLMEFQPKLAIVGQVTSAEEAIQLANQITPDVILMDIHMPGMDGITAAQIISQELPDTGIVLMSIQSDAEQIRQARLAGANQYLAKPFTGDELLRAVKAAHYDKQHSVPGDGIISDTLGHIITVFSTKGGIGKTTISTNLAVAIAEKTGKNIVVVDADLHFGDVALFMNLLPQKTIADLANEIEHVKAESINQYLTPFNENVKVLPAPFRPEQADIVTASRFSSILSLLRQQFQYVIVDTAPVFNETIRTALDAADQVLIVSALDVPTIKNIKLCLEIMESLQYPEEKIKVILNRANSEGGMEAAEVEEILCCKITATLPSEGKVVVPAVNKGIPFVLSHPDTLISESIYELARTVDEECSELQDHPF
ncbi:response regulator [bacterium BFN5]|nr:response regulator [bacterium BFN5]